MIVVFVVATVTLHRDGLTALLGGEGGLRVVGSAESADDAALDAVDADIFVVDVTSDADLAVIRHLTRRDKSAKVVAVGVPGTEEAIMAIVEAGVSGFVLADENTAALVGALRGAVRGEIRCSPRVAAALARRVAALAATQRRVPPGANLTARELEIVELIDERLSNKEIARVLQIEVATVKNHVHNILEKLQVSKRADAAAQLRSAFREHRVERIKVLRTDVTDAPLDPRIHQRDFGS